MALYSLSHPGPKSSTGLITDRFVWPRMKKDIKLWCRLCHRCQISKVVRHVKAPVTVFPPALRRFGSLHVNIVGPLPPSEDYRYLLTVVDRFTRWPESFPLKEISAINICRVLLRRWFSRFGVPDEVKTDREAQFTGATWKEMLSSMGIALATTTAYHPQA